jgi:DNA-binding CsgD family transcriptional regulator/tetratricopeptide (TPR) repeat protein
MRGREHELRLAGDCLREAAQGQGQVLLIEGEPGIGKSALLAEVAGLAGHRGFTLAAAAADELGQLMAFAPLIAALPESPGDLAGAASVSITSGTAPAARGPAREFAAAGFGVIQGLVERRTSAGPVLISLDDLHWADPATLTALRVLPRRLATRRLAWVLARRTAADGGGAGLLFDLLEKEGAARITLGPLTSEAVAAVLSDALGARPGRDLTALAAAAAGQPFLLTELLRGLAEAGTVRVSGQTATLTGTELTGTELPGTELPGTELPGTELPGRLHTAAQRRLGELTGRTRTLLEIMAVLGDSFQLDDAADMLGEPPAGLLPLVNEALAAGILIAGGQAFSFRQPLLWRAVAEAVPVPARHALHRQFGEILLGRGDCALTAASHLVEGARRGDPAATAGLDQAVAEVVGSAPGTAADLAVRALELTLPDDADRYPRLVRAADVLTAAARLDEAAGLVRDALAQPLPTAYRAQLRAAESAVLSLQGRPAEANAAAQTVLAWTGVPGPVRDEAVVAQLQALSALGDNQRARAVAQDVLARPAEHGGPALAGALTVLGAICWADGQLGQGLQLCREAARRAGRISPDARHFQPLLVLAARLIDLRQFEEASAILRGAAGVMQPPGQHPAEPIPTVLRARADLAQGRTEAARAAADTALGLAGSLRAHPQTALARSVLSVIAFRAGDLRAAGQHLRGRPDVAHFTDSYAGTETMLARAQFVEAAAGPKKAAQLLGDLYAGLGGHRQVLTGDPAAAAWLARTALAAGRPDLAAEVVRVAEEIARDNPAFPVTAVAAAHCAGLVSRDPARLAHAAASHPDPWARASAAEDLGHLLASAAEQADAVVQLDSALAGYGQTGADRDMARVRRRLRELGVRRRSRAGRRRPVSGWTSLTPAEQATSNLVAQGLSNQQVAGQMYVSAHTVAYHLRNVFRKLGISSRVELARVMAEHGGSNGTTGEPYGALSHPPSG